MCHLLFVLSPFEQMSLAGQSAMCTSGKINVDVHLFVSRQRQPGPCVLLLKIKDGLSVSVSSLV